MAIDKEIVEDFLTESKLLIDELLDLLSEIESDFSKVQELASYANKVDRVMGGAKNLALLAEDEHALHMISDYAALCKIVGYQGADLRDNEKLFDVCVALLLDATEILKILLDRIYEPLENLRKTIPNAFIERLRWLDNKFTEIKAQKTGAAQAVKNLAQSEIDDLLKSMGF